MKKVLLATTALALSAGVAYAEISMSGSARMGLVHSGKVAGSAFVQGKVNATATTGHIARVTALAGGSALASFATAAGDTRAQDVTALNGLIATLATAKATADAAKAASVTATGASTTSLDNAAKEAADKLSEAQAILADIDGTAAVADTAATTLMEYRTRISLTGSGETDSGLAYSGTIRLQDSSTTPAVQAIGVTISGAFGSLTFGTSSSAAEYAVGDIAGVGYTGLGGTNETSFLTGSFAMYSYTAGAVTVYASAGQIGTDDMSFGASFSSNGMTVGAGYEDNGTQTATSASASYAMGDTTIKAVYMDSDKAGEETGVSVKSTMGAVSVAAFYKSTDSADHYGVGASYDIGGASVTGGIVDTNGQTRADLGMTFKF